MATSYLKSQFSIPHHLVPQFEDVRPTSISKRRSASLNVKICFECVSRLSTSIANVKNHRFNPDISPYDSLDEDFMYKKSRASNEYKKAKIYQMEQSKRKSEENSFQQILKDRKELQNEIKDDFSRMKVPRLATRFSAT